MNEGAFVSLLAKVRSLVQKIQVWHHLVINPRFFYCPVFFVCPELNLDIFMINIMSK